MTPAESYPLSWPFGWPRTPAAKRKRAQFSTRESYTTRIGDQVYNGTKKRDLSIYGAMRRLTDEIGRLGGTRMLLSSNVETRRDGQPRSDRRPPEDPGVAIYFVLNGKDRVLACDKWDRVADNIAAIAAHIDAIRRQERYGVGTIEQAFAGYAALPPPGQTAKRPWREVLIVRPHHTLADIEAAYRTLARERHPDFGGSTDQMAELNAAIADARRELR